MNSIFMTAEEVASCLGVSKAYAYKVIQKLNKELSREGYITLSGKVNRNYFMKKVLYEDRKEEK